MYDSYVLNSASVKGSLLLSAAPVLSGILPVVCPPEASSKTCTRPQTIITPSGRVGSATLCFQGHNSLDACALNKVVSHARDECHIHPSV